MIDVRINHQKPADKMWRDESTNSIPYDRTTKFERKTERTLSLLAKSALNIHTKLSEYKTLIALEAREMYDLFLEENNGKPLGKGKGNSTFYNFDRSIKMEVAVNENIEFDSNFIGLAKQKLDELLSDGLSEAKDFVKPLVMDAFSTARGALDTKRVLNLRKYADRIKDPRYAEAMTLIDKAIRKPTSKTYFRIWVKDAAGQYQDIQLNFSAI